MLVVCPINPFEWPVKASVAKFALHGLTGAYKDSHYRRSTFITRGRRRPGLRTLFDGDCECGGCVSQAAEGVRDPGGDGASGCASGDADFREDWAACRCSRSEDYNMYELVSILRACHMMASSRYHGIVTSMPGLVPSAGSPWMSAFAI